MFRVGRWVGRRAPTERIEKVRVDERCSLQAALAAYFHRHAQWRAELAGEPPASGEASVAAALARLAAHVAALPTTDPRIVALSDTIRLVDGRFIAGEHVAGMLAGLGDPPLCTEELLTRFTAACVADAAAS